ncbi:N-acetylglucosamine kinase-like BadF-type ATPase [Prauserella isguenensis]|uniref:N-acetylglucosamine kinase-like BadF-type ATPase n=2 Tax=Prauserella isguenensis TaxID=1470180 RepID=A0A839S0C9_9PSEU|nr:N-acetylglucosamine kinase-like BadF-type ATPase [Prauserella isguenensis]
MYVVGVDAGGTSTRACAVDADMHVLGTGRAGGANPNSHPPEKAASAVAEAVAAATVDLDRGDLGACVVGMAGSSKLTDPDVATLFERTWRDAGFDVTPQVVSDAETAFASATDAPDGTVLVAGTGSIAGRIRDRRMVSISGGYGWLLGDEGSGFWIGREAVRATLDALTRREALGELASTVLAEAGVDPAEPQAFHLLITAVNGEAPVRLARFAPLVSAAVESDPVAARIADDAADRLSEIAFAARDAAENTPIVLVGSVLGEGGPVRIRVHDRMRGCDVRESKDGVLGAAWLAALRGFGRQVPHPNRVG